MSWHKWSKKKLKIQTKKKRQKSSESQRIKRDTRYSQRLKWFRLSPDLSPAPEEGSLWPQTSHAHEHSFLRYIYRVWRVSEYLSNVFVLTPRCSANRDDPSCTTFCPSGSSLFSPFSPPPVSRILKFISLRFSRAAPRLSPWHIYFQAARIIIRARVRMALINMNARDVITDEKIKSSTDLMKCGMFFGYVYHVFA